MDDRYTIRGTSPYDYLQGYEFGLDVLDRILDGPLALPKDAPRSHSESGRSLDPTLITVRISGVRNPWHVRRLQVAVGPKGRVDMHLTWLAANDSKVFNRAFPVTAIRNAFRESGLDVESREWREKRAALLPDPGALAARYPTHDKILTEKSCPLLITALRKLRDEAPPVTVLDEFDIGANDSPKYLRSIVADGYGVEVVWSDGWSYNRVSPDQGSPFGDALLNMVGDAEECAGLESSW